MGSINNQFGLNINPQFRSNNVRRSTTTFLNLYSSTNYYGNNPNDLRNKYSLTSQLNDFKAYLNRNGMTLEQFQQAKWEAQMMAKEQQSAANQEAISSTFTNLINLATTGKGLFDTVKGWLSKDSNS